MKAPNPEATRRQVVFWRLLSTGFGGQEALNSLEQLSKTLAVDEEGLPELLLDPSVSIDNLLQRYPKLEKEFDALPTARPHKQEAAPSEEADLEEAEQAENTTPRPPDSADTDPIPVRHAFLYSKLLVNLFGPNALVPKVTAAGYQQWLQDCGHFEKAFGYAPGELRGGRGGFGGGPGGHGEGGGQLIGEDELRAGLKAMEGDLIKRMALREVLGDPKLAAKLSPSMALVTELLRDKSNLSGEALKNARALIRRYIEEVSEVLRTKVVQTPAGKIDHSVPPKRTFRNLNLKKTIWRNLPNWNNKDNRLYVDRLFYHHKAKKTHPTRLIVVVDQSGSMVEAMVHCTILASIFAGLPHVDARLMAFDTRVIDLSPWVSDPFEVLLRTQLGGGTYIRLALLEAEKLVEEPANTVMVLISDYYEGGSDQELLNTIKSIKDSGVKFIPVGAVTASGSYSVNQWFRQKLKELNMPILSGSITRLIEQLKAYL
jgi:hypothetical protein